MFLARKFISSYQRLKIKMTYDAVWVETDLSKSYTTGRKFSAP
jgi:hypothetical protein